MGPAARSRHWEALLQRLAAPPPEPQARQLGVTGLAASGKLSRASGTAASQPAEAPLAGWLQQALPSARVERWPMEVQVSAVMPPVPALARARSWRADGAQPVPPGAALALASASVAALARSMPQVRAAA
ncbi:hypothetical protein OU995_15700 [Roseateles sp. SL47]|uniref:hypothetical protein n=1 Tax=Roseateles sp. SL47 TaxID=2995138 RepID=UPI00226E585A|nr:hypothetical protein [Roseateles sp. SL47]WAC71044.1 hypothetical protein OU995_15700 [Roseateles sp. SL47]